MEKIPYREDISSLQLLSNVTRPDISYAVSQIVKYLQIPTWSTGRLLSVSYGTLRVPWIRRSCIRVKIAYILSVTITMNVIILLILMLTTLVTSISWMLLPMQTGAPARTLGGLLPGMSLY